MLRRLLGGTHHTRLPLGGSIVVVVMLLALMPLLAACGPKPPAPHATIYASTQEEVVSAIDAASGSVRWTFRGAGMMGIALAGDTLYAAASGGVIYAIDARTGKIRWQFRTAPQTYPLKLFVSGDTVYVTVDNADGKRPSVARIYAFNSATGALRWQASLPGYINSDATFTGSLLYISVNADDANGGSGTVYALRISDGTVAWRAPLTSGITSGSLTDGTLYVTTADGVIQAMRASDGATQWARRIVAKGVPLSSVASNGATLFVGDGQGTVHALRARDGATQWTRDFPYEGTVEPGQMVYNPSMENGALYLTSVYSPNVYALSPSDGSTLWSHDTLGYNPGQPPVVIQPTMYVIDLPGSIQILDAQSGSSIASYDFTSHRDLLGILYIVVGPPLG